MPRDPVGIILQSLQAIYDEYPAHRSECSTDEALDASLRIVLTADDLYSVRQFHAGLRDDEYGLCQAAGGQFLYGRLVHSMESHYDSRA